MPDPNSTVLEIRRDGPTPIISVPEDLEFNELRAWIRSTIPARAEELTGRNCRLDLGQRAIKLFDIRRLLHLLQDEFSIDIRGLYVESEEIHRYAERELKLKLFNHLPIIAIEEPATVPLPPEEPINSVPEQTEPHIRIPTPEMPEAKSPDLQEGERTLTIRKTVRSGASIQYDGHVMIFGDTNPGSQVIATGNVIVFGRLKGTVHAGAEGDEKAFIIAHQLAPIQLRIGTKIAIPPVKRESTHTELAHISNEKIVFEPYNGRLVR